MHPLTFLQRVLKDLMSYQQQFLLLEKWLGVVYWRYLELLLILVSGFVCVFMFCIFIEDQEIINSHDESQQKELCWDIADKPVMVCIFYAWLSCLLAHMQICLTRQDLIRVNELLTVWNIDNVWPEFKEVFCPWFSTLKIPLSFLES